MFNSRFSNAHEQTSLPISENIIPLENAHAHSDLEHTIPLFDALNQGFTRLEPDVFILLKGKSSTPTASDLNAFNKAYSAYQKNPSQENKQNLNKVMSKYRVMVGHDFGKFKGTLYDIYIKPVQAQIEKGKYNYLFMRKILKTNKPYIVTYMIDLKTPWRGSVEFMNIYFSNYPEIFNNYNLAKQDKPISVILSGYEEDSPSKVDILSKEDISYLLDTRQRYVSIDGRVDTPLHGQDKYPWLFPQISNSWNNRSIDVLKRNVSQARKCNQKIRFWGIADEKQYWQELYNNGVDIISTDDLVGLKNFLLSKQEGS